MILGLVRVTTRSFKVSSLVSSLECSHTYYNETLYWLQNIVFLLRIYAYNISVA
nr:MAG TPA: hypothetical protein [Caudoviricetes sp.]